MASEKIQTEPIASEPVIVNKSDAATNPLPEGEKESEPAKTKEEILSERVAKLEETLAAHRITNDNLPGPGENNRVYFRGRSRSRSPIRVQTVLPKQIIDSAALASHPSTPDLLAEVQSGPDYFQRTTVYITNLSFHSTDLEKIDWVFRIGLVDVWTQNVSSRPKFPSYSAEPPRQSFRRHADCYFEDRHDDRNGMQCAIAKMGNALRVFEEQKEDCGAEKVKFVTVVQGKGAAGWMKLVISYSRQAALVDIFHEILNNNSILFVGAVLKDAEIPVVRKWKEDVQFKKVETVAEAEACGENVVGVIC